MGEWSLAACLTHFTSHFWTEQPFLVLIKEHHQCSGTLVCVRHLGRQIQRGESVCGRLLFPPWRPRDKRNNSRAELPRDGAQHLRLPLLPGHHGALAQVVVQSDRLASTLFPEGGKVTSRGLRTKGYRQYCCVRKATLRGCLDAILPHETLFLLFRGWESGNWRLDTSTMKTDRGE